MTAATLVDERRAPGVYSIPEEDYFAARYALSASGAKDILDCPARFRHKQLHPEFKAEFDYGSAAHKLVLGSGPEIQVVDAELIGQMADTAPDAKTAKLWGDTALKGDPGTWQTSAASTARDRARAAGRIPLLRHQHDEVQAMAAALRAHPKASTMFDPSWGIPEQSLFWHDDEFGIDRRCRLDWLPDTHGEWLVIPDYKSCACACQDCVYKSVGNWAYHIQRAFYVEGARVLGLDDAPGFVFCFQEKQPPYLVNIVQLDQAAIVSGDIACRAACEIFRDCTAADVWPGYPYEPDITEVGVPPWKTRIPEGYHTS